MKAPQDSVDGFDSHMVHPSGFGYCFPGGRVTIEGREQPYHSYSMSLLSPPIYQPCSDVMGANPINGITAQYMNLRSESIKEVYDTTRKHLSNKIKHILNTMRPGSSAIDEWNCWGNPNKTPLMKYLILIGSHAPIIVMEDSYEFKF